MKITYTSCETTSTLEREYDDITIEQLGKMLYNICLSQGWHSDILKDIFKKEVINGQKAKR